MTQFYWYRWMIIFITATITTPHISAISTATISSVHPPHITFPLASQPPLQLIYDTHSLRTAKNSNQRIDHRSIKHPPFTDTKTSTSYQDTNSTHGGASQEDVPTSTTPSHWIRWRADISRSSNGGGLPTHTHNQTDVLAAAYTLIGDWIVKDQTTGRTEPQESVDGPSLIHPANSSRVRQQRMKSKQLCHFTSSNSDLHYDHDRDQHSQQSEVSSSLIEVDGVSWFECEISQLPLQTEIRLMLIAQASSPRSTDSRSDSSSDPPTTDSSSMTMPTISTTSSLIILPSKEDEVESATTTHTSTTSPHRTTTLLSSPSPLITNVTIDRIANDTQVRADLALFYNLTNGPNWSPPAVSWNLANLSICDWFPSVLVCDQNRTIILELNFGQDQLSSNSSIDINFVFIHITTLVVFSSPSQSLELVSLDLSNQINLRKLVLTAVGSSCLYTVRSLDGLMPLYLPLTTNLTYLDLSNSCLTLMNLSSMVFPFLETVLIDDSLVPLFPLAAVVDSMPSLVDLSANGVLESHTPDSDGRVDAALTTYWLENLNSIHPHITSLNIGGSTQLVFDSNFPIPRSDTLHQFDISVHNQIYVSSMPPDFLAYLPQLSFLSLFDLPNVNFDLSLFERAATTSLKSILLSNTHVRGSLDSLKNQSQLQSLNMDQSNLVGTLPQDLASFWPHLSSVDIGGNSLVGSIPSFANLPLLFSLQLASNAFIGTLPTNFLLGSVSQLQVLDISSNGISGPLPTFTTPLPFLFYLSLDHNNFNGSLSTLFGTGEQVASMYPSLSQINLQSNQITGTIPLGLWHLSISHEASVQLSHNLLSGSIPSPSQPTLFFRLLFTNNLGLNGPFPQNLTAIKLDVSYTNLSGPVLIPNAFPVAQSIQELNLAFTQLTCPLDLSGHQITNLDIQSSGFGGCDLNDPTEMNINWEFLQAIDISQNPFTPFRMMVYPSLSHLRARSCNLMGFVLSPDRAALQLQTLIVDSNYIGLYSTTEQIQDFISAGRLTLSVISFLNCSLNGPFITFMEGLYSSMPNLNKLLLGFNELTGVLPLELFGGDSSFTLNRFPYSLQEFDISNNLQITGYLPPAVLGYSELERIDVSFTSVSGALPESWSTLLSLQQLSLEGTQLRCSDPDTCTIPLWLTPSTLTSPSTNIIGAHCPQLTINQSPLSLVTLDEQYYAYDLCTCDSKFFGPGSVCQSCPIGCTCQDDIIQGCFPILTVSTAGASPQSSGSISIPFIIPCPLTVTGSTLCNPAGVSWSNFDPSEIFSITTSSTSYDFSQLNLTSFCAAGHTSRLCAKCADGYFASGRWCLECSSDAVHVIIIAINLLMLLILITVAYHQLPSTEESGIELDIYLNRSRHPSGINLGRDQSSVDYVSVSSSSAVATSSLSSSSTSHELERSRKVETVRERTQRNSASPLKLLIFHCQQLSLLLSTTTSQPSLLTGFLSFVSSGSTGFSLSSLVSLECLNHLWSIQHKLWMSLAALTLVGLVCLCIYLYQYCRTTSVSSTPHLNSISLHESINHDPRGVNESERHNDLQIERHGEQISTTSVPRLYGVCLVLLYFFLFPCAQTVLSAIACTDARQYDGSLPGVTSSLYLNLLPWVACDSQWSSTILPPAIIGVLVWIIAFPLGTTLLTYYLFKRIRSSESKSDPSQSVHLWPLCADLFTRFKGQYWYYEQILLVRRLLLVGCVTLIPSDSLYLPVILFSIIQLSALVQHQLQPYESVWLNRGELVSLYLLLLNYITALILHKSSTDSLNGHSLDGWSIILFLSNLIFILILIGGLFLTFRTHATQFMQRLGRVLCCRRKKRSISWSSQLNGEQTPADQSELIDDGPSQDQHDFHAF